jgi:lysozyme
MIAEFEGFRQKAYKDSGGVWTIGYGSTRDERGNRVSHSTGSISPETALKLLHRDVLDACTFIRKVVSQSLTQNQFDALVSLVYNIGSGNFQKSKLLKNINAGLPVVDANFLSWNTADGKVIQGLTNRRKKELSLFRK